MGDEKATHPFARVSIGQSVMHTAVAWQSTAPMWDEKLAFKGAAAGTFVFDAHSSAYDGAGQPSADTSFEHHALLGITQAPAALAIGRCRQDMHVQL